MTEKIITSVEQIFSPDELAWLQVLFIIQMKLLVLEGQADDMVGTGVFLSPDMILQLIPEIKVLEAGVEMSSHGVGEQIELYLSETLRDRDLPTDVTGERINAAMSGYAEIAIDEQGWRPQIHRKNP